MFSVCSVVNDSRAREISHSLHISDLAIDVNLPVAGDGDDAALLQEGDQLLELLHLCLGLRQLRISLVQLGLILLFALLILLVALLVLRHQTLQLLDLLLLLNLGLADGAAGIHRSDRRSALPRRSIGSLHTI